MKNSRLKSLSSKIIYLFLINRILHKKINFLRFQRKRLKKVVYVFIMYFRHTTSSIRILGSKRDSILRDPLRINKPKILAIIMVRLDSFRVMRRVVAPHNARDCIMKFMKVVVSGSVSYRADCRGVWS